MNLTLIQLSISSFQRTPFFSSKNQNYEFKSCALSHFLSPFFYSSNSNIQKLLFSSTHFSKFLFTPIVIEEATYTDKSYSRLFNVSDTLDSITIKNCRFFKCTTLNELNSYAGGIYYKTSNPSQTEFSIISSSFISCSSEKNACFYVVSNKAKIKSVCAMSCFAHNIQIFNCISFTDKVSCKLSQFDQCSTIQKAGSDTSLQISSPSIEFNTINHSRCAVRNFRCCGGFFATESLKYSFNTNMNCTGSNYLQFSLPDGNKQIEDTLFYQCHSFNELDLKCAIFLSGHLVIQHFQFFKTQLNVFAKWIGDKPSSITLINCVSDIKRKSLKIDQNSNVQNDDFNITLISFIFEDKRSIVLKNIDYLHWKCATEILPKKTNFPSMSHTINRENLHNQQKEYSKSSARIYLEIFSYLGLTLIVLISLILYLMAYREDMLAGIKHQITLNDSSSLLNSGNPIDNNVEILEEIAINDNLEDIQLNDVSDHVINLHHA
ncbi:hypothetical protein TRFO_07582 [Tritrichomonas foetus]|uniref:Right handed beta helix domain-containing protein n=1 Tax=Tritrichomonas foetus TaxID=1144522 RepID=A0A1J4JVN9_9EUKA|nr:hypothetical protein TRFO_07582 [Tritrichomonas foetus]|eukprot:OHT01349.1 hypothetical protein TRFO_07582 [Tritrichomonas foetus]